MKQIHRFIKNEHVSYEAHYLPFIGLVIASLGLSEFRLSIDSSQAGRNCLILTIGLVYKKRVIPLAWLVYKGKKGHSSGEKQVALVAQVQALLPEGAKVIVTGDAEFDGTELISWLQAHATWDYVCRTAKNSQVRASKGVDWSQDWYRRRFKIETLFADVKSRGFGLNKSGIRHPERLARFVIALFLAYIWLIYLGVLVIQDKNLVLIPGLTALCTVCSSWVGSISPVFWRKVGTHVLLGSGFD